MATPQDSATSPAAPARARGGADAEGLSHEDLERLRQMELLLDLSKKVAAIESLDEILETLVEMTTWELEAERGTLFLNDPQSGELYSRVAQGNFRREIRILNTTGVAGHVFQDGQGVIIDDAYSDPRFNRSIDEQTGYRTNTILCAPVRTVKGEVIGVIQVLNKKDGTFSEDDLKLLEAMTTQAAVALQSTQFVERMKVSRKKEMEFLDVVADVTSELELGSLLQKVMGEATKMLAAERSTLFLNDEKKKELFSRIMQGTELGEIRFPNHLGIAGAVFTSGETINIPHAYADLRFNPAFDKKTGFFTRSILCVPVINKSGKVIGVTQCLNKRGGPFTHEDEQRLKAFTAQVSIALENAKLFDDVQSMKNYNESMLESMSNGVITMDEDGRIVTCNKAGLKILRAGVDDIIGKPAEEYFTGPNTLVMEKVREVEAEQDSDVLVDVEMTVPRILDAEAELALAADPEAERPTERISVNLTFLPLVSGNGAKLGSMVMIEDISSEKRIKSTMSRYMDPGLADQLLAAGDEDILGGKSVVATMLFSDIRSFTTLTEELGPQGTVSMLNEYFTIMVDCLGREGGMLDKFIGDAIMAAFGLPLPHEDDEDRAVRTAISMIRELWTWNKTRETHGQRPVDIGIGINTDNIVSGNIGSPKRMDYTAIGDGVNLAARLESACKQYGARILISEYTYKKLKGTYRARDVDRVVVKGKTKPVEIYEVLDYHDEESFPNLHEALGNFRDARAYYNKGKWAEAIKTFQEVLKINPNDKAAMMYVGRCQHMIEKPPEGEWEGVWVMQSK